MASGYGLKPDRRGVLTAEDLALYDDAIRSQLPPDAGSWLEPGNRAQAERQATAMV